MLVDPAGGAGRGGCREVGAAASHLQDPGVPRPPPRPGPRPGAPALTARPWLLSASRAPAALLRQPGRGWQAASAGRTRGAGQSQGRGPRRGRRSGCAALRAPVGCTLRRAARQEPASAVVGRAKATLSLRPPRLASSRAAAAEVSSRGNYADPSRGSSPRPFSAPSPWLGSRCWPARGRRLWQPEPGGGGGRRSPTGHSLALPCDAVLRPATPRAPRARAPPRRAPCSCRDPRARRPRPSPRSISASAGR